MTEKKIEVHPVGKKPHRSIQDFCKLAGIALMSGLVVMGAHERSVSHAQGIPRASSYTSASEKMESVVKVGERSAIYSSDISKPQLNQKLNVSFSNQSGLLDKGSEDVKLETSLKGGKVVSSKIVGDVSRLKIPQGSVLEVVQRPNRETVAQKDPNVLRFSENVNETRMVSESSLKEGGYAAELGNLQISGKDNPMVISFVHSDGKVETLSSYRDGEGHKHLQTNKSIQSQAEKFTRARGDDLLR